MKEELKELKKEKSKRSFMLSREAIALLYEMKYKVDQNADLSSIVDNAIKEYCNKREHGLCDICGHIGYVKQTIYKYDVQCSCCSTSPYHMQSVHSCEKCEPKEPTFIHLKLKAINEVEK